MDKNGKIINIRLLKVGFGPHDVLRQRIIVPNISIGSKTLYCTLILLMLSCLDEIWIDRSIVVLLGLFARLY